MHKITWDGGIGDMWSLHEHSTYMAVSSCFQVARSPQSGRVASVWGNHRGALLSIVVGGLLPLPPPKPQSGTWVPHVQGMMGKQTVPYSHAEPLASGPCMKGSLQQQSISCGSCWLQLVTPPHTLGGEKNFGRRTEREGETER